MKTPKEKAIEIYRNMYYAKDEDGFNSTNKFRAKECALIAVDEVMKEIVYSNQSDYWDEVKQEIKKL